MRTAERFDKFLSNLNLTNDQVADGVDNHKKVRRCLNLADYGSSSDSNNSRLVGSWGKDTRIRPPRDIDVLFELPDSVYQRFEKRVGNKQSQLLQEVKSYLSQTFSTTNIRGDGPVVLVPFSTYAIELVPAFKQWNGSYLIPITNDGGKYKSFDPHSEITHVADSNDLTRGNTRDLIRMMKCWQSYCSVPIKSFWLELVAVQFLNYWEHKGKSTLYYDWMVRDFFQSLIQKANGYLFVPGTGEGMFVGDAWKSKAETAHERVKKAITLAANNIPSSESQEWQKIFGFDMPSN